MKKEDYYALGVKLAMAELELVKEALTPYQQTLQNIRTQNMASGNRYAAGYNPNIPLSNTEQALNAKMQQQQAQQSSQQQASTARRPNLQPVDYTAEANKVSPMLQSLRSGSAFKSYR